LPEDRITNIGQWLSRKLKEEHLSLRDAAAKTGLSHSTIADIVNGATASTETVKKLARAFAGNGQAGLALEDYLLVLAGHRTERAEAETAVPLGELMDIVSRFDEAKLELMVSFASFLARMEKKQ